RVLRRVRVHWAAGARLVRGGCGAGDELGGGLPHSHLHPDHAHRHLLFRSVRPALPRPVAGRRGRHGRRDGRRRGAGAGERAYRMSTAARVVAHAKLNLLLHVLDRRSDGYHDIATWLVRLALGDDVVVRVRPSGRGVECRGADVGPPERNLALRAAEAYVEAARWPAGFAIEIDKRIPVGGGLGGGSADAGAVLRALDALAPEPLGEDRLIEIAARLGSDV